MSHTACTEPQCLYKGALYFTFASNLTLNYLLSEHISSSELQTEAMYFAVICKFVLFLCPM